MVGGMYSLMVQSRAQRLMVNGMKRADDSEISGLMLDITFEPNGRLPRI